MDHQMSYKRVFTKSTAIFHGTITVEGALLKEIIEEMGFVMYICHSKGLSSFLSQTV